jgi:uncharacterized membrane protein
MQSSPLGQERALTSGQHSVMRVWIIVLQAFQQFLLVPVVLVLASLGLAAGSFGLDHTTHVPLLNALRALMSTAIFSSPASTASLLSTIASSLITVASITFSFMVLAVQGSASGMTTAVLGQFLKRNVNQIIFGYFIGLAVYTLAILSTVNAPYNPVYGATISLLLTFVALMLLPILFYSTIYQMQPAVIVASIHQHILHARQRQEHLLQQTRRTPRLPAQPAALVRTNSYGFVTNLNVAQLRQAVSSASGSVEIVFRVQVGSYVTYREVLAEIRGANATGAGDLGRAIQRAVALGPQRDYHLDPGYGVDQVRTICWTTASTAKQNPEAALSAVQCLQDLLARLSGSRDDVEENQSAIVLPDGLTEKIVEALRAAAVVGLAGHQYMVVCAVVNALAENLAGLSARERGEVTKTIEQVVPSLTSLTFTPELGGALRRLADAYGKVREPGTQNVIIQAVVRLECSATADLKYPSLSSGNGGR